MGPDGFGANWNLLRDINSIFEKNSALCGAVKAGFPSKNLVFDDECLIYNLNTTDYNNLLSSELNFLFSKSVALVKIKPGQNFNLFFCFGLEWFRIYLFCVLLLLLEMSI